MSSTNVSIHVPARGTTTRSGLSFSNFSLFQSTFPQGERRKGNEIMGKLEAVSIHVPARGTTHGQECSCTEERCFNPRSRKGNDPPISAAGVVRSCFNPRSRKGNDLDG